MKNLRSNEGTVTILQNINPIQYSKCIPVNVDVGYFSTPNFMQCTGKLSMEMAFASDSKIMILKSTRTQFKNNTKAELML